MFSVDSMGNLKHRAITALTATVIGCSGIALAPTSAVAQTYNTNDGDSTQHGSEPNFNNSWGPSNVPDGVDPGPAEKQVEQSKTIGKCVFGAIAGIATSPAGWGPTAEAAGTGCLGPLADEALD